MSALLSWAGFFVGGWLCALNFYLSFLRYPVHRMRGMPKESYRWVSGIPVFGSAFVALSLIRLHSFSLVLISGIVLIAIDTGGIHWFVGSMIYQARHGKTNG
jgi:hypothetical protein